MKKFLVPILFLSLLFTGCWDQRIFERTGFILLMGIESSEKGEYLFTETSPVIEEETKEKVELIEAKATLSKEARENWKKTSPKILEGGKIQEILFSTELAEKGMHGLLETFERDPANPTLALVAVVDGSPNELIKKAKDAKNKPRPGFYITQLLDSGMQFSYIPETRVYDFDVAYFAPGLDPITPLLGLKGDEAEVRGSALFHGDKMVGKLDTRKTSILLAMMNKFRKTEFFFKGEGIGQLKHNNGKKGASVLLTGVKRKVKISNIEGSPFINIDLKFEGIIDEFEWDNIEDAQKQKQIEEQMSLEMEQECQSITEYIKSVGSDPIGIGDMVRARNNNFWKTKNWDEAYKDVGIKVTAAVGIKQFGEIK